MVSPTLKSKLFTGEHGLQALDCSYIALSQSVTGRHSMGPLDGQATQTPNEISCHKEGKKREKDVSKYKANI